MPNRTKIKFPKCPICHVPFTDHLNNNNNHNTTPLLLQCGHTFCNNCLSNIFSSQSQQQSLKPSLTCPKCRHVSSLGNSLLSLPKNYALLSLLSSSSAAVNHLSDSDSDSDEDDDHVPQSLRCGLGGVNGLTDHVLKESELLVGRGCKHKVVVKKVRHADVADIGLVETELEKLRRKSVWCKNVCGFYGVVRRENELCIVMEKCYGSVQSEMQKSGGRLTLEQILRYGADIARSVAELHAAGVVCANLWPSNFLLSASGHTVVSDYGLPMVLKKPSCPKARSATEAELSRVHWCIDCMSLSPHYTAPEVWEPSKKSLHLFRDGTAGVSAESDSWSFGCALVEMCTGSVPWASLSAEEIYHAAVKDGRPPPQYATVVGVGIPRELWKMIGECLHFKASKRPTFHAMLAVFLRHLQGIPQSPTSHANRPANCPGVDILEQSPTSVLDIFQVKSSHLHQLVSEGNVNGVRDLLAKSASGTDRKSVISLLEAHNPEGQTALHLACRRGCPELVDAILQYRDVDVDIPDEDGNPPVVFALAAGSPECVRAVIRRSENGISRLRESGGQSVAHICAFYGQPECMRELLLAGADSNAVDDDGDTVLHVAIAKKFIECALVVLECGGSRSMGVLNSKKVTPLHLCIENLNVTVVKKWLEVASPEDIAEAIDVPSSAGTALCMAAALKKCREKDGRELVRILLAAGADPAAQDTEHHRTALHTAAMANDVELVKIILEGGVNVNLHNIHNTIPLHLALARGAKQCVELLLDAGADCSFQDDDGDNAFHIAAETANMIRENLQCIIIMLQYPSAWPAVKVKNNSGKNLCDLLEALPREWIPGDLVETLANRGTYLSPTIYQIGDWITFKKSLEIPMYGRQGTRHGSIGFVRSVPDSDNLIVSFCTGVARVLAVEVQKVIPLDRGQLVQMKPGIKEPRYELRGQAHDSIGTVLCVEDEGIIRIGFTGASRGWQADPADFQRVEEFKVGDWIRVRPGLPAAKHGFGAVSPGNIGIICGIRPDSSLLVEFSYLSRPWLCEPEEIEPVVPFKIGELVCVKRSVAEPKCAWGGETHHSVGRISDIENNGLLIIEIPNRPIAWKADPSDMERVYEFKVGNWVRVKASVPSPKYGWEDVTRASIGIVHSLGDNGDMNVAFCFRSNPFACSVTDMEKVSPFKVGEKVHLMPSVTQPQLGWSSENPATFGNIASIDMDGALNVRVVGRVSLWKIAPGDAERLPEFVVGDWVQVKQVLGTRSSHEWIGIGKESVAIVHSIQDSYYLELVCCFRNTKLQVHCSEVEKVSPIKIGQHIKFRAGLVEPRWGWRGASPNLRGVVTAVNAIGEVRVLFFGLPGSWRGDPSDLEIEQMLEVGEWVKIRDPGSCKYLQHGSIGVVHGMEHGGDGWDGTVHVAFCGVQELWVGPISQLESVDKFMVGQRVRVKPHVTHPQFGWSGQVHASIGRISAIDADGKLRVCTPNCSRAWMLDPAEVELVEEEKPQVGDWVMVKTSVNTPVYHWGEVTSSSIGVVHRIEEGELFIAFCFLDKLWVCKEFEMEKVRAFKVGDRVTFKRGLVTPRWGWGMETPNSKGEVVGVDANGKLRIKFKWREGRPWIGDPADIVLDEGFSHMLPESFF